MPAAPSYMNPPHDMVNAAACAPTVRLQCVQCRTTVNPQNGGYACRECEAEYSLRHGVPSFLTTDQFWQIASAQHIEDFLASVQEVGWDAAVSQVPPNLKEYWFSKLRADFRAILPERHFGAVLDLGCGAGAVTGALAASCGEIWGIDACLHSLRILQARALNTGLTNLHVAHATATSLPFADGQFDLIIMNGVLERVGYAGTYRFVQDSQKKALAEAFRCLRPGGYLYIGIENRFGANYLLGAQDEHTGLRWVNVLPRALANIYSKLVRRKEFTAFTHSYLGLRGMLQQAGFQPPSFWSPLPSYREIRMLEPLMDDGVNLVEAIAKSVPHRVPVAFVRLSRFVPTTVWRHLSPHFAVIAKKAATRP